MQSDQCLECIAPIVAKPELSRLYLASVAEQTSISLSWSHTTEDMLPHGVAHMSLVTRKPVFGVSNQDRLKSACAATVAR